MKTPSKKRLFVFVLGNLIWMSSTAPGALEGNGEGASGPDLSGVSIPVAVDRVITLEDTERATEVCAKELRDKLSAVIFRGRLPKVNYDFFSDFSVEK